MDKGEVNIMHHREITLADGRYLIFYTFEPAAETAVKNAPSSEIKARRRDPTAFPLEMNPDPSFPK